MNVIRRLLGVLVMLAGLLGLLLSLTGLVMVWVAKPQVAVYAGSTLDTLNDSVVTSQSVMEITREALGATIDGVDALADMLGTTATTIEDTQPVLEEIDTILSTTLPTTLEAATDSLYAAQEAARVLESTMQSLDTFRLLLSTVPLVGDVLAQSAAEPYSPDKALADSLGELAANLEGLPVSFTAIAADFGVADDQLTAVRGDLKTMSDNVQLISSSLAEYERMVTQSQSSMDDVSSILASLQGNLPTILRWVAIALSLFLVWLLAAQVVILSQGWELFQGTADRMES